MSIQLEQQVLSFLSLSCRLHATARSISLCRTESPRWHLHRPPTHGPQQSLAGAPPKTHPSDIGRSAGDTNSDATHPSGHGDLIAPSVLQPTSSVRPETTPRSLEQNATGGFSQGKPPFLWRPPPALTVMPQSEVPEYRHPSWDNIISSGMGSS